MKPRGWTWVLVFRSAVLSSRPLLSLWSTVGTLMTPIPYACDPDSLALASTPQNDLHLEEIYISSSSSRIVPLRSCCVQARVQSLEMFGGHQSPAYHSTDGFV
ncbi:hypothetical protein IW262DRAFT_1345491 [Armillaria fumosa]|nr:hypothetical protein IW262DRAFT_1345491 [Armillaria fumosa]